MPKLSINQLSEFTGYDRRTITRRLNNLEFEKSGVANLYEAKHALHAIYNKTTSTSDDGFNLEQERARLAHHQANNEALKEEVMKKTLIPSEQVKESWITLVARFKSKMLSIPSKMAHQIAQTSDHHEIEHLLRKGINEALTELSCDD